LTCAEIPDHQITMKDLYPLTIIFVPTLAVIGFVVWVLRIWIGRQNDAFRARSSVAQVTFRLALVITLITFIGQIYEYSTGRASTWIPHPSILVGLAMTGILYANARKTMRKLEPNPLK
jgi:hypothetical protein